LAAGAAARTGVAARLVAVAATFAVPVVLRAAAFVAAPAVALFATVFEAAFVALARVAPAFDAAVVDAALRVVLLRTVLTARPVVACATGSGLVRGVPLPMDMGTRARVSTNERERKSGYRAQKRAAKRNRILYQERRRFAISA
jgi:hypothetical protein